MYGFPSREQIRRWREMYPPGTRVQLDYMPTDPAPIPTGTKGTVMEVDDIGTVHTKWDNGRQLGLIIGEDQFHVIQPEEAPEQEDEEEQDMGLSQA